jgi:thiamine kinase-like enzyme
MGSEGETGHAAELAAAIRHLEAVLGLASGEPLPLGGGITNRNYRVRLGGRDYVVRFPGKDTTLLGIDRDAERTAAAAASRLGIAPALAAVLPDCLVTEFVSARELPMSRLRRAPGPVARALRRFHDQGPELPVRFHVPALLEDYAAIVTERGGAVPDEYAPTRAAVARIHAALPPTRARPCHNDLLNGNLLLDDDDERVLIVDWEYTGMGDPYFDLGNLSVNNEFEGDDDERLLAAYLGAPPGSRERARLALMRILSDAREAAWGVVQLVLSDLDFDFAGYAQRHFTRLLDTLDQPEFEEWLDAAAA